MSRVSEWCQVPWPLRESRSRVSEWCEVPWALGESMSGGVAPGQGAPTLNALITLVLLDFIGAYGIALGAMSTA